ncbi:MAG: sigma 54-interacting transcriptional regulator [Planctomycetota bacterium]
MTASDPSKRIDDRFIPLIFDAISHGIFTIDSEGLITSFNRKAEDLTGYASDEVIGKPCSEVFRADICKEDCMLKHTIRTGQQIEDREVNILTRSGRRLPIAINTAALISDDGKVMGGVEIFRDLSPIKELRKRLYGSYVLEDIVSKSRAMQNIFEMLPLVANSRSNILIEGESGTGKELIARAAHNLGPRKDKPFVAINCAALPDTLLESELFGYEKGAFTDAKQHKPGRFERAEGGTLFFDEIGDLSPSMQVKLLRVLQEREYEPLGATASKKTDARIIAATNSDLSHEVQRKKFRQDLYFRLNVVRLTIPPLRDRREDIPLLIRYFIDSFNAMQGRRIQHCSERVMSVLMSHSYPGNVRELENAIEHAFVVCVGDTIQLEDMPPHLVTEAREMESVEPVKTPLQTAEEETIRMVLEKNKGNRIATAKALNISRNTLWRKMKRYGVD